MKLTETVIRSLPKVLLHDHLDGGLRPRTIIELAKDQRYKALPTTNARDGIFADGYTSELAAMGGSVASGYTASLQIGI